MIEEADEFAMEVEFEFDAPQHFDFCRPEKDSEAQQAERWFQSAVSDPPSPIIIRLNLGVDLEMLSCDDGSDATVCSTSECGATLSYTLSTSEENFGGSFNQHTSKAKAKLTKPTLSWSSTLMKPTESHLAKLNQTLPLRRLQKSPSKNSQKTAQHFSSGECPGSKRQKLEGGYLCTAVQAKHQLLLLHKVTKKTDSINIISVRPKLKVTIPKEPLLVTARRAEIRRSKQNADSPAHAVPNAYNSTAHPLNRKILQLPRKTTSELSEFQESKSSSDTGLDYEPPVDLFSKLSLEPKHHN